MQKLSPTISKTKGCTDPSTDQKETAYKSVLIHGSYWDYDDSDKSIRMTFSEWQIYHPTQKGLERDDQKGYPAQPPLYGIPKVLLIGVACFAHLGKEVAPPANLDVSYKVATTQVTAANIANLKSVLNAWLGTASAETGGSGRKPDDIVCKNGLLASSEIADDLPYDLAVTVGASLGTDQGGQGGQKTQDCATKTKSSCVNGARTFHNIDAEYWDISAAVALPGVREPQYAPTNPAVQMGPTRHTDFYGVFDIYPFASVASKTSLAPHFAIGIPVTGKVFYRPFFGIGESITGAPWFRKRNIPQIGLLYGVVYLNQQVAVPNTAGTGLKIGYSRTLKGTLGLEISLSPLLGKIKALGGSSSSGSGGAGGGKSKTAGSTAQ